MAFFPGHSLYVVSVFLHLPLQMYQSKVLTAYSKGENIFNRSSQYIAKENEKK